MSLNTLVQSAVQIGMKAAGDLTTSFTYSRTGTWTSDPVTGVKVDVPDVQSIPRGILTQYTTEEEDPDILPTDLKLVFPKSDLTGADPAVEDQIIIGSTTYNVVTPIRGGTGNSIWRLKLRRVT